VPNLIQVKDASIELCKGLGRAYQVLREDKSKEAMKQISWDAFCFETDKKTGAATPMFIRHGAILGALVGVNRTLGAGLKAGEKFSTILTSSKDGASTGLVVGTTYVYAKCLYLYLAENERRAEKLRRYIKRRAIKNQNALDNPPLASIHSLGFPDPPSAYAVRSVVEESTYRYL